MKRDLSGWKNPSVLLTSTGLAGLGDFIYLVAINILVYQLTGSAAAVAGLWIIGPLTNIFTKFWTGSYIDYRSKKAIMMKTYLIRAGIIALIPFAPGIVAIYGMLILLSIAKAFFVPSSVTYITMTVPKEKRKRFNAIRSFTSSGAFIVGPAVGGALIFLTSIDLTLWLNALFFVFAALLLIPLPDGEKIDKASVPSLNLSQVLSDFTVVRSFMADNRYFTFIYLMFIAVLLFSFAMDAQEVVFTQKVIGLSEVDYTLLISITGIGSVTAAMLLSVFSHKISIRMMIAAGLIMMTAGYVIYAFSWSFTSIAAGFIILGFFNVFLNAGMATFYQNNIPVEVMGRVTSIFQLVQSVLQVFFILMIGVIADIVSLRLTIVVLALSMLAAAVVFSIGVLKRDKVRYYLETDEQTDGKKTG
ncbi:MFS transporter [Alteribacter natronophilus]|uniref:MFS transporter n=1 Tax=Alteribacter natronophilus TaxID=2583810 RepID=UPI00110D3179|nr:MFS transporter [Alteribacter natronophilus]TMW70374.1 MFS transporter [Alteribacter natronophilus]